MNIFATNECPEIAAQDLCDKHVVKMVLETAQLLSTVARMLLDDIGDDIYKSTHTKHPCTLWAASNMSNMNWLIEHGIALSNEYTYRYKKVHKSLDVLLTVRDKYAPLCSVLLYKDFLTPFALAMPEDCKNYKIEYNHLSDVERSIVRIRNYYLTEKKDLAEWNKDRKAPYWYTSKDPLFGM